MVNCVFPWVYPVLTLESAIGREKPVFPLPAVSCRHLAPKNGQPGSGWKDPMESRERLRTPLLGKKPGENLGAKGKRVSTVAGGKTCKRGQHCEKQRAARKPILRKNRGRMGGQGLGPSKQAACLPGVPLPASPKKQSCWMGNQPDSMAILGRYTFTKKNIWPEIQQCKTCFSDF